MFQKAPYNLSDILVMRVVAMSIKILREFFNSEVAVFVLINFHKDFTEYHDFFLRQLRSNVVEHQHLKLCHTVNTYVKDILL